MKPAIATPALSSASDVADADPQEPPQAVPAHDERRQRETLGNLLSPADRSLPHSVHLIIDEQERCAPADKRVPVARKILTAERQAEPSYVFEGR